MCVCVCVCVCVCECRGGPFEVEVCVCVYEREEASGCLCERENTLPFQRERKKPSVDRRGRYPAEAPMCHGRLVKT